MENKKNIWIAVGALVVVALLGWSLRHSFNKKVEPENSTEAPMSTEDTSGEDTSYGATKPVSLSYKDALIKYKDARLQLDKVCQASPDKMTFKNNSYLMVDNRSALPRTIKVGSTFNIKAYGFKVIKLSSSKLPTTWYVDCDNSQNVSTITIQK